MLERVIDNWWLARESASAVMGLWSWPWGRQGPSGFGSASTAEEVTAGVDATNLTAIVTGLHLFLFLLSVQCSDAFSSGPQAQASRCRASSRDFPRGC